MSSETKVHFFIAPDSGDSFNATVEQLLAFLPERLVLRRHERLCCPNSNKSHSGADNGNYIAVLPLCLVAGRLVSSPKGPGLDIRR